MTSFPQQNDIIIDLESVQLKGILNTQEEPAGMVIFSHGSGSSRLSSRNNYVAHVLNDHGFATLLFDLLTEKEDLIYQNRFDIALLTDRLVAVTQWLQGLPGAETLPIGYFGASTGAASAIKAAARLGSHIKAVVSRGGRPDLAGLRDLATISAPVLLIVGGYDLEVIELNREAFQNINTVKQMSIVEKASHLFGEPGKLQEVTMLSAAWFRKYLKQ